MQYKRTDRRGLRAAVVTLFVVAVAAPAISMPGPEEPARPPEPPPSVTVVGSGVVEVEPDMATVRIGVETVGESVDAALAENRDIIADMKRAFIELGIAEDDLQTANYSFNFDRTRPEPVPSRQEQGTRYYRVNNMLTVIIRDLEMTADIIDAAVVSGANQMWGVDFGIADRESVEQDALMAAVFDARDRAEYLASLSNMRIGEILRVSEVVGGSPGVSAMRADGLGGSASNVTPGRIRFSTQLEVVYSLVPAAGAEGEPEEP